MWKATMNDELVKTLNPQFRHHEISIYKHIKCDPTFDIITAHQAGGDILNAGCVNQ